jgi:hypothetical protein
MIHMLAVQLYDLTERMPVTGPYSFNDSLYINDALPLPNTIDAGEFPPPAYFKKIFKKGHTLLPEWRVLYR